VILILGATGAVGGACVRELLARGEPFRALVRSAEKAERLRQPGLEPAIGDLEDPASLDAALEGVERALLVSPLDPRQVELQGNFIAAARRAGSVHVIKLSGLATALDSPVQSGRWHARTEQELEDSGLPRSSRTRACRSHTCDRSSSCRTCCARHRPWRSEAR
jgi:uncharacterized protein YbjT (DUF2867 family)